jgi:signal transduction histidine kinase
MTGTLTSKNALLDDMHEKRKIEVQTAFIQENIVVNIADTGPGIPLEDLQHIFDPFFTRKKKMGMGVGLSICHGIVEEHGGLISANNSPHGGVVMTITLPLNEPVTHDQIGSDIKSFARG